MSKTKEEYKVKKKEFNNKGVIVINIDKETLEISDKDDVEKLFDIYIKPIEITDNERDITKVFDEFKKLHNTSKFLYIVDGYLFHKDKKCITYNISRLFEKLLPEDIRGEKYEILIFTNKINEHNVKGKVDDEDGYWRKKIDIIADIIKSVNPNLDFEIKLYTTNGYLHDRCLITNHLYLFIGKGFDISSFDERHNNQLKINKRTTWFAYYPFCIQNSNRGISEYNNIINKLRGYAEEGDRNVGNPKKVVLYRGE